MTRAEQEQILRFHVALPASCRRKPASEADLTKFEAEFGSIPQEFRWYLTTCGGGVIGSEWVDGIVELKKSHLKFRREAAIPQGWTKKDMFIFGWDGFGNPMGIEHQTGRVVVEDHNFGGVHVEAASFGEFLLKKMGQQVG